MVGRREALRPRPRMDFHLRVQTRLSLRGKIAVPWELPGKRKQKTSVQWHEREVAAYLATAVEAYEAGHVDARSLKPLDRQFISSKLIPQFGMLYDAQAVKNYWDRLKKDYKNARKLLCSTIGLEYKERGGRSTPPRSSGISKIGINKLLNLLVANFISGADGTNL